MHVSVCLCLQFVYVLYVHENAWINIRVLVVHCVRQTVKKRLGVKWSLNPFKQIYSIYYVPKEDFNSTMWEENMNTIFAWLYFFHFFFFLHFSIIFSFCLFFFILCICVRRVTEIDADDDFNNDDIRKKKKYNESPVIDVLIFTGCFIISYFILSSCKASTHNQCHLLCCTQYKMKKYRLFCT